MANDAQRPTDGGDAGVSDLDAGRRGFLKGALAAGGGGASPSHHHRRDPRSWTANWGVHATIKKSLFAGA